MHNIQVAILTIFKAYNSVVLSYIHKVVKSLTRQLQNLFNTPKRNPVPISSPSPFSPFPITSTNLLCLYGSIQAVVYYSTIKSNEILTHATM